MLARLFVTIALLSGIVTVVGQLISKPGRDLAFQILVSENETV